MIVSTLRSAWLGSQLLDCQPQIKHLHAKDTHQKQIYRGTMQDCSMVMLHIHLNLTASVTVMVTYMTCKVSCVCLLSGLQGRELG